MLLNCSLPSYCSLFKDTDGAFGSRGSLFNLSCDTLRSLGGSYECNPPFDEHLMQRVVATLSEALTATEKPLSIALVMPDWTSSEALMAASSPRDSPNHLQEGPTTTPKMFHKNI